MATTDNQSVQGSEENLRRRGRTKLGCWMMGCAIPLGLVMLPVIAYGIWHTRMQNEVLELRAGIIQRGEPLNAVELNKHYHNIEGKVDKSARFLAAIERGNEVEFIASGEMPPIIDREKKIPLDRTIVWEQKSQVREFLRQHGQLLDEIEAVAMAPGVVRFSYDFCDGIDMERREVQRIRSCLELLRLRVRFAVREGNGEQAFETLRAMLALPSAEFEHPNAFSLETPLVVRWQAIEEIADLMPMANWTDEQLMQLRDECLATDWPPAIQAMLIAERAMGGVPYDYFTEVAFPMKWVAELTAVEDERIFLQCMTDMCIEMDHPFPENLDDLKERYDQWDRTCEGKWTQTFSNSGPVYAQVKVELAATVLAVERATAAQLAIELYRRRYGDPPIDLIDLVPDYLSETPLDPFSGQMLRYRVDENEIIVYSVGENRIDDKGETGERYPHLDHAVRVPRK